MRKGIIPTVSIDSDQIRKEIKAAGYSIRSLAPEIGVDRRAIMNALKVGEMQIYLLKLIEDKIHLHWRAIWMRIGVTVPVTSDELFDMMEQSHMQAQEWLGSRCRIDRMVDYDLTESEADHFLKRAVADGESYIPEGCFDEHIDWWLKERERRGLK